ncbi:zinc ribbon domain-containing protein [Desulfosporosinus metallidurans]|uniref:Uncharacterized protein n=1 Tax=Desulfosporosinus metallidurans TaxID=1888891 RepID=A0A1Q8QWM4_9FIRM|nr:zinc ribbon domain-containing protein [Desulfosporosinus metallidurans]OLN31733.1 hypothetical protein DSOL_2421 [Desulfosporosinus metallidurans]
MDRSILLLLLLGVLGLGFYYLMYKVQSAASKALMTKVFLRSMHKEGQSQVNEQLDFETPASILVVMDKLKSQIKVSNESLPIAFKGVLYQSSISPNRITYAFGHKLRPKSFEAEVVLTRSGTTTKCVFRVLSWVENSGIVTGQDEIKKLRQQVLAAFKAADASGKIINETGEQTNVKKGTSVFCSDCGKELEIDDEFCGECGTPSHGSSGL